MLLARMPAPLKAVNRVERNRLALLLLLYLAASLLHFAHNAENLADYSNLPAWLTQSQVYLAWCAQAAIGAVGFALYMQGRRLLGLVFIGLHAALGFDGLLHYSRAAFDAHTAAMNFTIWFEAAAAALLLGAVTYAAREHMKHRVSA